MTTKISPALMIKEKDIEQLLLDWSNVPPWIKAHTLTRRPPHRYEGELAIEGQCLAFRGRDIKEGKGFEELIPLNKITEVSLGFDEHLSGSIDPSFGIGGPVPFIVRYKNNGGEQTAYFNTNLNHYLLHRGNGNREWYETLEDMIDHNSYRELRKGRYSAKYKGSNS